MWGGIDKRAFPRANYPCRVKVTLRIFSYMLDTHTENIGIGGICVILDKQLNKFSDVDVELFLDDGKDPIRCMGRIMWVIKRSQFLKTKPSHFDTGIEFIDIASRDRARISVLIDKIREKDSEDVRD